MNKLLAHSHIFRQNILAVLGVLLCFYFSYHALLGHRSVIRYYGLEKQIETMSLKNNTLQDRKNDLHKKVVMMRPGTINSDLLEEQVRLTLGYRNKDELVILSN